MMDVNAGTPNPQQSRFGNFLFYGFVRSTYGKFCIGYLIILLIASMQ